MHPAQKEMSNFLNGESLYLIRWTNSYSIPIHIHRDRRDYVVVSDLFIQSSHIQSQWRTFFFLILYWFISGQ